MNELQVGHLKTVLLMMNLMFLHYSAPQCQLQSKITPAYTIFCCYGFHVILGVLYLKSLD